MSSESWSQFSPMLHFGLLWGSANHTFQHFNFWLALATVGLAIYSCTIWALQSDYQGHEGDVMHHLVQTNWTVSLWRGQTWTRTDSSHQSGNESLILIFFCLIAVVFLIFIWKKKMQCGGFFSLTHSCEISGDGSFWCWRGNKSMINSNPNDLPCTFNFMASVSSKVPPGSSGRVHVRARSSRQVRETRGQRADSYDHILSNNDAFRDHRAQASLVATGYYRLPFVRIKHEVRRLRLQM